VETPNCNRCGAVRETSDNFCRKCGHQLTIDLPAVRPTGAVQPVKPLAISVPIPPAVVRGVAVLALSTGVEWMLRRMAGNAAKAAGRSLIPGAGSSKQLKAGEPRQVTIDEVLYVRKVQLRR
jgi:hypothetical protein